MELPLAQSNQLRTLCRKEQKTERKGRRIRGNEFPTFQGHGTSPFSELMLEERRGREKEREGGERQKSWGKKTVTTSQEASSALFDLKT